MTTGFGLFSSLSKVKIYFFLLFTSNLSYFNSFKLPYKIRLLGFRSPLILPALLKTGSEESKLSRILNSCKLWSLYEIIHVCSAVVDESEERSFSNLSNWKEEAWKLKNQSFNGIRTRDLHDTGAMLYQLSYEATNWERGQFIEFISSRAEKWCEIYMK